MVRPTTPGLEIRPGRLDDPVAVALVEAQQLDLTDRYGGPDPVVTSPVEFAPPYGIFLLAWLDGEPVGCAGVKDLDNGVGELKRMYVTPSARGRGVARALLAGCERAARDAGAQRLRLVTGEPQPEAVGLYTSAGWLPGEPYGPVLEFGWKDALVFERTLIEPR